METGGVRRLNRSSPSCLNTPAQRTDFFHGLLGQPVASIDTKKKELVGRYRNGGREWRPKGQPEAVKVHDFIDPELGKAIPYQPVAKVDDSGSTKSIEFRTLDSHGDGQKTGGSTGVADVGGHGGPSDE